jgi:tetratricopeptide (TPR) repeat protein
MLSSQTTNPLGAWYELSIISGLAIFLALACLSTPVAEGIWKKILILVAALSFVLLIIINAREVWIGIAVVSIVYGLVSLFAARHVYQLFQMRAWRPVFAWGMVAIIAVFFVFFGSVVNSHLPRSISISQTEVRPSWYGTFLIGSHALTQPSRFVFGTGPNTFMQEWALYKPAEVNQTLFWNTNFVSGIGSIPTSFISTGLFGGIAWILLVLMIMVLIVRLIHSSPRQGASMLIEPLFLGILFLIGFHIVYVPGPALSILTFLLLGLTIGYATSLERISHWSVSITTQDVMSRTYLLIICVFVLAGIVVCLIGIARVITAEMLINKSVVTYNTSGDLTKSTRLVSSALRIYPKDTRGQRAAVELGILQIAQISAQPSVDDATIARLKHTVEEIIHYGLNAVAIDSDDYQNWLELANLYHQLAGAHVSGAYENAQHAYATLIAKNPTNPLPYLLRARLELLQNNTNAALNDLATAIRLKPDFAAAYYVASQVLTEQKDFKDALLSAEATTRLAPNDPLAWYNLGAIAYTAADYTDATTALEHALSIEPQYANAAYALGLSYYQLGRVPDAIKTFQKLRASHPDQTIIKDILANLEAGKSPFTHSTTATTTPSVKIRK